MSSADTASTLPSSDPSDPSGSKESPDSCQSQSSTFDTQPMLSQEDDDNACSNTWGQLTVIGIGGITYDLVEKTYIVGRSNECQIQLTDAMEPIRKLSLWKACSKQHFKIYQEEKSSGKFIFIEDLSTNGTIVNNDVMGQGTFAVLKNGDVISLVKKDYKAFLFTECNVKEKNDDFPIEVRSQFMFIQDLGKGAFGTVKLAIRRRDKLRVACKCIEKSDKLAITHSSQDLLKEAEIIKRLDHPCIIKVVSVIDTEPMLFLFMDLVEGGDLLNAIKIERRLDPDHAKTIFYQTCLAVQYLHKNNVVHRDLKPENILLSSIVNERQIVKVTDFGYSIITATSSLLHTICGTSLYLAPELVHMACLGPGAIDRNNTNLGYTKAVDCWSLGVILFVCITGQPPFSPQRSDMPLHSQILQGNFKLKDCYWEYLHQARDLVNKLLTVDHTERITLDEALEHAYFKDKLMLKAVHKLLSEEQGSPFVSSIDISDDEDAQQPAKKAKLESMNSSACDTPSLSNDLEAAFRKEASNMSVSGLPYSEPTSMDIASNSANMSTSTASTTT